MAVLLARAQNASRHLQYPRSAVAAPHPPDTGRIAGESAARSDLRSENTSAQKLHSPPLSRARFACRAHPEIALSSAEFETSERCSGSHRRTLPEVCFPAPVPDVLARKN